MARKKKNYTVKGDKIIANILNLTDEEIAEIAKYRAIGYTVVAKKPSKAPTKDEMLAELATDEKDKKVKEDFEKAYKIKKKELDNKETQEFIAGLVKDYEGLKTTTKKGEAVAGYHLACQIYSLWKKAQAK